MFGNSAFFVLSRGDKLSNARNSGKMPLPPFSNIWKTEQPVISFRP
jgi:hypothetical protein